MSCSTVTNTLLNDLWQGKEHSMLNELWLSKEHLLLNELWHSKEYSLLNEQWHTKATHNTVSCGTVKNTLWKMIRSTLQNTH